jgi:hypothetical protein
MEKIMKKQVSVVAGMRISILTIFTAFVLLVSSFTFSSCKGCKKGENENETSSNARMDAAVKDKLKEALKEDPKSPFLDVSDKAGIIFVQAGDENGAPEREWINSINCMYSQRHKWAKYIYNEYFNDGKTSEDASFFYELFKKGKTNADNAQAKAETGDLHQRAVKRIDEIKNGTSHFVPQKLLFGGCESPEQVKAREAVVIKNWDELHRLMPAADKIWNDLVAVVEAHKAATGQR